MQLDDRPPVRLPVDAVHRHGLAATGVEDFDSVPRLVRDLDLAVLVGIAELVFRTARTSGATTPAGLAGALLVAPRHHWILEHWLRALARENMVDLDDEGALRRTGGPRRADLVAARRTIQRSCAGLGYPPALAEYLLGSLRALPALLRDEVSAQALLFPGSDRDTADAVYHDNVVNRYLNAAATEALRWAVTRVEGPVRVLELGAGTGATTADLLPVLAGGQVDYLFTDLSPFFLRDARERFARFPFMRYGLLDFNDPIVEQCGQRSVDLVVAVNTAHNAVDVPALLAQIRGLLGSTGALLLVETCQEHPQSLASMPFLLSPRTGRRPTFRTDRRAGSRRTYLTRVEWLSDLAEAGLSPVLDLPPPDHPLAALSQHLLVATG